ncbi:pirin family protein [Mucilaginibacter sp. HMF5004]|uniref:pirin family protein n=1 Tax=Mucilaginibacter rivuli TaxID=2857527 RepID=UPI001C5DC68B|nr:pirin family protein [Mucilaginibacter rivuli]MBW4889993.1 pirin family protein [Mucilaginibacter rivuli]
MKKQIERIITKPVKPGMVGDGFRVYNYIPGANITQQRISPFLMLDFNAEFDFGPSEHLRGVDVHPHKGFETVTIAYKGSVAHHDSAGNSGIINPGDVQWMTAGGGILHKEYHEQEFSRKGGPFEMVQLWVNLPKKDKLTAPHYQAITNAQMGKVELPNGQGLVNVIAGNFNGTKGAADTYTPVNLFDIKLKKGAVVSFSLPANYNTAILVINGSAIINDQSASEHSFVLFKNDGEDITVKASEDAVLLVLSGEPINEPIASYGPFVMNTHQEIIESMEEFRAGKFGVLD